MGQHVGQLWVSFNLHAITISETVPKQFRFKRDLVGA